MTPISTQSSRFTFACQPWHRKRGVAVRFFHR